MFEEAPKPMPHEEAGDRGTLLRQRVGRRLALGLALAGGACGLAAADELAPTLSPDRIEDAPSTRLDPYPTFDNFAWRAFVSLNWPARSGADGRGEPERAKSLRDCGRPAGARRRHPAGLESRPGAPAAALSARR